MSGPLAGKSVAIVCAGSDTDRAIAVACADAGANLALATVLRQPDQEFAVNSIANEAWAMGRNQFARLVDSLDPVEMAAFADEVCDRFGRCDALVAAHHAPSAVPLDELALGEWRQALDLNLTGPFLAAQAFGRTMERDGGGRIVLLALNVAGADAAYWAATAGLDGLADGLRAAFGRRNVTIDVLRAQAGAAEDLGAMMLEVLTRDR